MKKILCAFIIAATIIPLYAAVDWGSKGFQTVAHGEEDDIVLQKGAMRFLVINQSVATDADAAAIEKMNAIFSSWQFIKIRSLKYVISSSSIDVFIIPRSFEYNGASYMDNAVAGLQLSYTGETLRYSFRIRRGELFLKISGAYIEEEVLCKKIEEAVKDPQSFIQRRDADFLLTKIERIEEKIDSLIGEDLKLDQRLKEEITVLKAADVKHDETDQQITQKLNRTTDVSNKTRTVVVAYANNHLFYGANPIPQEKISKILQMRKNNPSLTIDELMKKFEEAEYKVTKKEVEIVLQAYTNEFKEK